MKKAPMYRAFKKVIRPSGHYNLNMKKTCILLLLIVWAIYQKEGYKMITNDTPRKSALNSTFFMLTFRTPFHTLCYLSTSNPPYQFSISYFLHLNSSYFLSYCQFSIHNNIRKKNLSDLCSYTEAGA